jgi:hypothetical protein
MDWYTFEAARDAMRVSTRTARERLATVAPDLMREDYTGVGRPRKLYYWTACPELVADHQAGATTEATAATPVEAGTPEQAAPIAGDDLAIAQLRLQAVHEYEDRCRMLPHSLAAMETARCWALHPRTLHVSSTERLPGNYRRTAGDAIGLGRFSPRTLRKWSASLFKGKSRLPDHQALIALAPRRKGHCGRERVEIADDLLAFVCALASATPRADVAKAVAEARNHWPAERWPAVSLATWERRVREYDPQRVGPDLNHSISRFRLRHSPDIEVAWDQLPLNGQWQIDDVTEDWYAHAADVQRTMRPYAYAIIRTRTRQWVALVTSETPIVQEQVRTLVGVAMASPHGGIPGEIKFERGTVACDDYLQRLLESIGVRVRRTSMDGGRVDPAALPDTAKGHFQGKAIIEANFRLHHNAQWMMHGQVGAEERHTGPARLDALRSLSEARAAQGLRTILPGPTQWPGIIRAAMVAHNQRAHGGLPEMLCPDGTRRHMTPDEISDELRRTSPDPIRVMDERMLPMFYAHEETAPVTRNGVRIHNLTYGRFDEALREFERVTVYASADVPDVAYVRELGRCIRRYDPAAPGDTSQIQDKRRVERHLRNKRDEAIQRALAGDGKSLIEAVFVLPGQAAAETPTVSVANADAVQIADRMQAARAAEHQRDDRVRRRFDRPAAQVPSTAANSSRLRGRRSLFDSSAERAVLLRHSLTPVTEEV